MRSGICAISLMLISGCNSYSTDGAAGDDAATDGAVDDTPTVDETGGDSVVVDTAAGPDTALPPSDTGVTADTSTGMDAADAYVPPPVVTKVTWDNVCTSKTTTFTIYGSNLSFGVVGKVLGCVQAGGIQTYAHTGGNTATRTFYCDPIGGTAGFTGAVTIYWQVGTTYTPLYSTNVTYQLC